MKNHVFLSFLFLFFGISSFAQRSYKDLMQDNTVNFYDACEAAETYFEGVDKEAKGSGWKGYQRWRYLNEYKYFPTGNRENVDPYFPEHAYERFLSRSPAVERMLFAGGWEEVGPVSLDSITGHYAPGLGRIEEFYVNPLDEDVIYIGSRSGGFWKTEDGGVTWEGEATDFLPATGVNTFSVSPTNQDSILINVRNGRNGTSHGIYRSTNGGDSFTESGFNPVTLGLGGLGSNFGINQVRYHPTIPNLIFVAANNGLYRSTDNLESWIKVTDGSISEIAFHPTDPNVIYIYDYYYWGDNKDNVLYSLDAGLTFTPSEEIPGNGGNTSVKMSVSPVCEDCIYFASGNGIWRSVNKGVDFTFISNPGVGSQGFAVSDLDTNVMLYGYVDAYASTDAGLSFDQVTWWGLFAVPIDGGQYIHADLRRARCINGKFYGVTDGLLGRSADNGVTWDILTDNIGIRENYTLGVSQSNHYRTMVGSQDNGTSIKHKSTWIEFAGADGMEAIIHPLNDDWMISSYQYGGRRRTFDGGQTQTNVSPPGHSSSWVSPMAYDPNDHMVVYHFGEIVHKSEDFGNSWTDLGTPGFEGQINEAAIAENNSSIIVVSRGQNIELSEDGGLTFTSIKGTLPNYTITDIAFDPSDDNTIVVTYGRWQNDNAKVFITEDMGSTWTNISANIDDMPILGAVIDHTPERNIYLAAEIGVYTKAMDATDWELYNDALPNASMMELEVVNGSNTLRGAGWGRGVWEYTLKDRASYPAIVMTSITEQPTYVVPAEESEQYVTSLISYDGELDSVYVLWSVNEPTFENIIPMENTMDTTWVTETPLPDYPAGTKLFFKVLAQGEADDLTETYKFMYTIQPFEYCASFGNMSWETSVTLVDFSDLNNPSGKPAPYTSYILTDTATVYQGNDYDFTMHMNSDGPYTINGKVWFDWNRDGDFEDPGEDYALGTVYDTEDGPSTLSPLSIDVPEDAHLGITAMRVSARYGAAANPCETGFDGEVEDYAVFIKQPIDLDYELTPTDLCVGDKIYFNYTGTYLDSLNWTFTNGDETYTSNLFTDSLTLTEPGTYSVSLYGFEGPTSKGLSHPAVFTVHPSYTSSIDATICGDESYLFDGEELTSSGEYVANLTTIFGCDSVVTLNLNKIDLDNSVTVIDMSLEAEPGFTYQWVDCNNDWLPIDDETAQLFTPSEDGSYAVIVTSGVCVDTSTCNAIVGLGLGAYLAKDGIIIYPNPSNGQFTIDMGSIQENFMVTVYDMNGKVVFKEMYAETQKVNMSLNVATGIYGLELSTNSEIITTLKIALD
jgi:hypothetical protein